MARRQAEANPYYIGGSDIEGQRVEAAAIDTAWQAAGRGEASVVTLTLVSPVRPFRGFGWPTWSR